MNAATARHLVEEHKKREKEISVHRVMGLFESVKVAATNGKEQIATGFALTNEEKEYLEEQGYQIAQETITDQRQGDYTQTVIKWSKIERPSFDNSENQH